jgi:hypothetical protein
MFPSEDHSPNYNPTPHNQPGTTEMAYPDDYNPDDYTQSGINKGQRKINYALTLVDEKLVKAIEKLRDAIAAVPAAHNIDLAEVNEAIDDALETSKKVAGIKPPGCDPNWPQ